MIWTPEEEKTLAELWPTHSARKISEIMGKTKSGIIGKVHRMGIEATKPKHIPQITARKPRRYVERVVQAPVIIRPVVPLNIPFMELRSDDCREIVGYEPKGLALFCGHPKSKRLRTRFGQPLFKNGQVQYETSSYCEYHSSINYVPVSS